MQPSRAPKKGKGPEPAAAHRGRRLGKGARRDIAWALQQTSATAAEIWVHGVKIVYVAKDAGLEGVLVRYGSRRCTPAPIPRHRTSIRHVRTAQDHSQRLTGSREPSARTSHFLTHQQHPLVARASRPRSSARRPTRACRTSPCAARRVRHDRPQDDGLAPTGWRKRSCGTLKLHTLSSAQATADARGNNSALLRIWAKRDRRRTSLRY